MPPLSISSEGQTGLILISCAGESGTGGGLCLFDGVEVRVIDRVSSCGLCVFDGRLARLLRVPFAIQGGEIVIYDGLGILRYLRIDELRDAHFITWDGSHFIVASTGTNSLLWINMAGEVTRRWTAPGELDSCHLNEGYLVGGRLYACAFSSSKEYRGYKEDMRKGGGSVFDLESGHPVIQGLSGPHNPRYVDGVWTVCDSLSQCVRQFDPGTGREIRRADVRSFPRGLTATDDYWIVGESSPRNLPDQAGTGSFAILRRSDLSFVARFDLPFQEVSDIVAVPLDLAHGVIAGFRTNPERVADDDQLVLFRKLGMEPKRLWAVSGPLAPADCRVRIVAEIPTRWRPRQDRPIACTLTNLSEAFLCSALTHPVHVSYKWMQDSSAIPVGEGLRSRLPKILAPGESMRIFTDVQAPAIEGRFELIITLVQEHVCWFDNVDGNNACRAAVEVRSECAGPCDSPNGP